MNVGELAAFIREQMDMDAVDLPDSRLNIYMQEAFDRTMAFFHGWPRNQKTWELSKQIGDNFIALPDEVDVSNINAVSSAATGTRLVYEDQSNLEVAFSPTETIATSGVPAYFSTWNRQMFFWPPSATGSQYDVVIRGFRIPVWTNATADIPDLDSRLHVTLAYAALSLAYAREEDEVMEGIYLARWNRDLLQQIKQLRRPNTNQPMIYAGAPGSGLGSAYTIVPPELP